jgi:hypothetical protein
MIGAPVFRYVLTPGWAGDSLARAAQAVPSLDLNFAVTKNVGPLVSFTRASTATYIDSAGTLQSAAVDVPRFDHNPTTGESLGLLVEEQRANEVRSSSMTGGATGTPGTYPTGLSTNAIAAGLTLQIAALGTNEGLPYVDIRVSGTSSDSSGFSIALQPATDAVAASGQTWTGSCYCSLVAGSYSNTTAPRLRILERTLAGGYLTEGSGSTIIATGTSLLQARATVTRTLTNALTARAQLGFVIGIASGVAVDFTLRFAAPQLELGAFASSYIPTTGTAATRNADVASITGSAFSSWYRQDEGAVFVETAGVPAAAVIYNFHDGTANNRIIAGYSADIIAQWRIVNGGVDQWNANITAIASRATLRHILSYKTNDFAGCANGGALQLDTLGAVPTTSSLALGMNVNSVGQLNGTIRRLTFWPQRLPNSTLQAITQ